MMIDMFMMNVTSGMAVMSWMSDMSVTTIKFLTNLMSGMPVTSVMPVVVVMSLTDVMSGTGRNDKNHWSNFCFQGGYSPAGPQIPPSEFYGTIGPFSPYGNMPPFHPGTLSWRGSQANIH